MARVELLSFSDGVIQTSLGQAVTSASCFVYTHGTTTPVTIWAAETGAGQLSQPLLTDNKGRIPGWVDDVQRLDILVQGTTTPFEAFSGTAAAGVAGAQGPPGVGANWKGVWAAGTTYALSDGVSRLGILYISNAAGNIGHDPSTDAVNWSPLNPAGSVTAVAADGYARTKVQGIPTDGGLRDFMSVKDAPWSATFDGVADDAVPLGSAQQGSSTLWLPNGVAKVNAQTVRFNKSSQKIRGQGMYATTLKGTNAALAAILQQLGSGYVSQVEIADLTLDGTGVMAQAITAYGWSIGRLTLRRVRFINFTGGVIDAGYASEFVIEDCEVDGAGTGLGQFFTATNKDTEVVKIRRCKGRYLHDFINIGATGHHAAYVEITDNDIDMGWWLLKSRFSGSGGAVTYSATGLADWTAAFAGIGTNDTVRAMPVRQSGTFTANTNGTYLEDTAAQFVTNGVKRGEIVRWGTSFAVVSKVIDATHLHVEQWLDQTTYQPVAPPASTNAYTVYGVILGTIKASTNTTLTVAHGGGGGGGGWYDLTGTEVTPAAGTRYEVLVAHSNYPIFCEKTVEKAIVCRNQVRRGWADNVELFASRVVVSDNIVEDGQDEGIVIGVSSTSAVKSVIGPNISRHNGTSGVLIDAGASDIEVAPQQLEDNGWGQPSANYVGQMSIGGSRVSVHGGRATVTGESPGMVGLAVQATATACKIIGFAGVGHSVADVWVRNGVAAASNEILDCTGSLVYEAGAAAQQVRLKGPYAVVRTADSSAISNQATPQTDGVLLVPIGASSTEIWMVEALLLFAATTTAQGWAVAWSVPAGCTMSWGPGTDYQASIGSLMRNTAAGNPPLQDQTQTIFGGAAASGKVAVQLIAFIYGGGTAGNVNLQWAQHVSDAGNLVLKKGSMLRYTKIAS